MNFGEKLKQLRTDKNLTQPQLADAIGIEQSYLSKLENDKSTPSAEIFQAILKALAINVASLLENIDQKFIYTQLRQIPEVANYLNASTAYENHNIKKWLLGSAAACVIGLTLIISGYMSFIFSDTFYAYYSDGVTLKNEPADIFNQYERLQSYRRQAGIISSDEESKLKFEFNSNRRRPEHIQQRNYQGEFFNREVDGGFRQYSLRNTETHRRDENNYLMLLGTLLFIGGLFGFIIEFRLRKRPTVSK